MPLISIIVPIYNNEKYLPACIDSLLVGKNDDIEVILVNDGSVDSCRVICDVYTNTDSRVKVIHQENQGVSAARNAGINKATGEWLMFVDGDDGLAVDYFTKVTSLIKKEADIIIFNFYRDTEKTPKKSECLHNQILSHRDDFIHLQSLVLNFMYRHERFNHKLHAGSACGKCYKASLIKNNGISFPSGVKKGEDNIFSLYAYHYANSAIIKDEALYYYRLNPESLMNRYNPSIREINQTLLNHIMLFFNKTGTTTHFQNLIYTKCVILAVSNVRLDFCHLDNKQKYVQRKRQFIDTTNNEPYKSAFEHVKIKGFPVQAYVVYLLIKHRCFFILNMMNKLLMRLKKVRGSL